MYLDFYRLNREPFRITPDPEFLYLSPGHKEALAAIAYGVEQRKGIIAVTGQVERERPPSCARTSTRPTRNG